MSHAVLTDSRLFVLLLEIDRDIAEAERAKPCPLCGGALHAANYWRKPRGGPEGLPEAFHLRFSNCCGTDGCRSRARPASVRFLGRKVYLGVVVALITAMRQSATATAARKLQEAIGASERTLERWRKWWREIFPASDFWKAARACFMPSVETGRLPLSLIEHFEPRSVDRVCDLMRFLSPLARRKGF